MRAVLPAVMIALVALAGCLEGDEVHDHPFPSNADPKDPNATSMDHEEDHEGEHEAEPEEEPGEEQEPEEESQPNQPPSASLTASIEQGTIPFNVTFSLDGTDLDGDALTWTLDANGDGTSEAEGSELPAVHTQAYDQESVYIVTFEVSDGMNSTVRTMEINATAAVEEAGPVQAHEGSWAVTFMDAGPFVESFPCSVTPLSGVTHTTFLVDEASHGLEFTASLTDLSEGAAVESWSIMFWQDGCLEFESVYSGDLSGAIDLAGTVPPGAVIAMIYSTGGVAPSASYSAG